MPLSPTGPVIIIVYCISGISCACQPKRRCRTPLLGPRHRTGSRSARPDYSSEPPRLLAQSWLTSVGTQQRSHAFDGRLRFRVGHGGIGDDRRRRYRIRVSRIDRPGRHRLGLLRVGVRYRGVSRRRCLVDPYPPDDATNRAAAPTSAVSGRATPAQGDQLRSRLAIAPRVGVDHPARRRPRSRAPRRSRRIRRGRASAGRSTLLGQRAPAGPRPVAQNTPSTSPTARASQRVLGGDIGGEDDEVGRDPLGVGPEITGTGERSSLTSSTAGRNSDMASAPPTPRAARSGPARCPCRLSTSS